MNLISINFLLHYLAISITSLTIDLPTTTKEIVQGCDSELYCDGEILKQVQLHQVYPDGKTFVDMATKKPLQQVLSNYKSLGTNITKESLLGFLNENFHEAGYELVQSSLTDYKEMPLFLTDIKDPILKSFGQKVHSYWTTLVRKIDLSKLCDGCVSSYLKTSHPFVVPGGRFREFYYWDTYFALQGLLLGELYDTSKNIILNFLEFVDEYGFMPNGARIYFLNRSQPPLLIPMVYDYIEKTKDFDLLKRAINTLDKEYSYWLKYHSVEVECGKLKDQNIQNCYLTRYYVNNTKPRPESYREDYITVELSNKNFTLKEKESLYADIATGAESGWDYSTRWLSNDFEPNLNQTNEEILSHLKTREVIPVDLNSIMYLNEKLLSKLHLMMFNLTNQKDSNSNQKKCNQHLTLSKKYLKASELRKQLMYNIFWNQKDFTFYDYNIVTKSTINKFSASNYWPYWTGALSDEILNNDFNLLNAFNKIEEISLKYPGGIPSTLVNSKLQWDLPNSWPPLEYVIIFGIKNHIKLLHDKHLLIKSEKLQRLNVDLSNKFVNTVFCAWYQTGGSLKDLVMKDPNAPADQEGHMFEKFNVTSIGRSGGGGEYQVQTGFGWTNGVLLSILNLFNKDLKAPKCTN
ncbi:glycoside hydrolase [Neoconidiobolus thromboides FSU 785]|nr:glycoside hydrolase [Neoconidiobolus thromboides FSU 785]